MNHTKCKIKPLKISRKRKKLIDEVIAESFTETYCELIDFEKEYLEALSEDTKRIFYMISELQYRLCSELEKVISADC